MSWNPLRRARERREDELEALDRWRIARRVATVADVFAVEQVVADARYHRAAVLALQVGDPLPQRRDPCFFDPRHGPSMRDVPWAPPGGVVRTVAVCASDARRLEGGEQPQVRMVRVGDRYVPSHEAGGIAAVADRHRTMRDERSTSHNRKNLAEAYIDQAINGSDGRFG